LTAQNSFPVALLRAGNRYFDAIRDKLYADGDAAAQRSLALMANFIDTVYFPFTLKRLTSDVFHYVDGINGFSLLIPQFMKDFWYMIVIYEHIHTGETDERNSSKCDVKGKEMCGIKVWKTPRPNC